MSGTIQKRLKLGSVKRKQVRIQVGTAMQRMGSEGATVLPMDAMLEHRAKLADCRTELTVKGQTDPQKQAAIAEANKVMQAAEAAIRAAGAYKTAHHDAMKKLYDATYKQVVMPLLTTLTRDAPDSGYQPPGIDELSHNFNDFQVKLRKAATPAEATAAFEAAEKEHLRLTGTLKALKDAPGPAVQSAKDRKAALLQYAELEKKILALEMANAPGAGDMTRQLYAASALIEGGKPTEAKAAFDKLAKSIEIVARNNSEAAAKALEGPQERALEMRTRLSALQKGPQAKMETAKGVLVTIGGKLDTLDLFLAGNQTPQSAVAATAMLDEIGSMLDEVGAMTVELDRKNKDAIAHAKTQLTSRNFPIFKGTGAQAEALLPERFTEMERRRQDLGELIEGMRMSDVTKAITALDADSTKLIGDAAAFKLKLDAWKADLGRYNGILKQMDDLLKADKSIKSGSILRSAKMAGPYADAVAAFEAGLDAKPPVETTLLTQRAVVEGMVRNLVPLNPKKVTDEYKAAKQREQDFAALKESMSGKIDDAEQARKDAADAVGKSKPGDQLELKSVTAEVKAAVKQVRGAASLDLLTAALERLETARASAKQLAEHPQGDAPSRRGKLKDLTAIWRKAAQGMDASLAEIAGLVGSAANLDDAGKKEIAGLVATARQQVKAEAFDGVIRTMTTDPSNDNLPARMKAREDGLGLVRRYRLVLANDPLITSLVTSRAFPVSAFTEVHQVLNNLDLNLSRAV